MSINVPTASVPTERRHSVLSAISSSRFYILCAIGMSGLTVLAVVLVILWQPEGATSYVNIIIGITAPMITALLGAGGIGVLKVIDGHQSQLMSAIAKQQRAEGIIEGLKENPKTNIE